MRKWKERIIINIIYDFKQNNIRLVQYDNKQAYQIEELFLYLPKNNNVAVYCRIIDSSSNESILKMNQIKQDGSYNIYQVALDSSISSLEAGTSKIYFLVIQNEQLYSKLLNGINLKYDNFSAMSKMFFMEAFSKEIKTICAKIEGYTKLNIQLYKDMREVKGLND